MIDPYFDPPSKSILAEKGVREREPAPDRRGLWLLFYWLNTIVPAIFAAGMLAPIGWLGLIAAVLALAAGGNHCLRRWPRLQSSALAGAILVGVSQLFPMLQIIAGMLALSGTSVILSYFKDGHVYGPSGLLGGFLTTTFTGLELLMVSLIVGVIWRAFVLLITSARDYSQAHRLKKPVTNDWAHL